MNKKRSKPTQIVILSAVGLLVLNGMAFYAFGDKKIIKEDINIVAEQSNVRKEEIATAETLKVEPEIKKDSSEESISMEITDEEFQAYMEYTNNMKDTKRASNRDFTEQEQSRRLALSDQYIYDNIRPKSIISTSGSEDEFFIDLDNDFLHFPKREITDEELLQLFDFDKKINYILSLKNDKENGKNNSTNIKDIDEEVAISKGVESVEKLFGVDTSILEVTADYYKGGPAEEAMYLVRITPYRRDSLRAKGEEFWEYAIFIDALTGDVNDTKRWNSIYEVIDIGIDTVHGILQDENWVNVAEDIVINKQKEKRNIISSKIVLENVEGSRSLRRLRESGVIEVKVELEDGSYYIVTLYYPEKSLRQLSYTSNK